MSKPEMLFVDREDAIVKCLAESTTSNFIDANDRDKYPGVPFGIRSMTKRKLIRALWKENRDFYYIDTGYLGNLGKRKDYHRLVKNNVQHVNKVIDVPSDRYEMLCERYPYVRYVGRRNLNGGPILLVTPSDKPTKFYNIDRKQWLESTVKEIRKHTDRQIIVRDKPLRRDRVQDGSIIQQFKRDNIHSLVTYNSIAAVEAVHFGIPAFCLAPNAASHVCSTDLREIENPKYPADLEVVRLLKYLCYCQYTPAELANGYALRIQEELGL